MTGKQTPTLEQRVAHFIREHHLVPSGARLLVAISGGPDSTCLLHLLVGLRKKLGIELHVAHLDHRLRGAESEADADYVERLANSLDIPLTMEKADVKAYQRKKRLSLEEAAREVRYRFLTETAGAVGADCIATGHTLDDQVETILMHLIRGTGTRGLIGLKPGSQWLLNGKSITIVRPLLEISRRETDDYCKHHRLNPCLDTSNLSLSPLRNRIRQQLLPLLRSYNPNVAEALLRTAAIAADEIDFLDAEVDRMLPAVVGEQTGVTILNKEYFQRLHPAIKRHLLRAAIERLISSLKDIETRHIEAIMAVLDKPAGKQISLPGGLIFSVEYDRYLLGAELASLCPYPVIGGEYSLNIPGQTKLPGWQVEAEIIGIEEGKLEGASASSETTVPLPFIKGKGTKGLGFNNNDFTAHLDLDKAGSELKVRHRKPGDRFQPLGMGQTKKVNKFMIDTCIPRAWRGRIPVVFSPQQILWLVGYRIDDRVKVTGETKRVLRLEFKR